MARLALLGSLGRLVLLDTSVLQGRLGRVLLVQPDLKVVLVLLDLQVVQGRLVRGRLGRLVKANKVLLALLVFKVLLVLGDLPD